MTIWHDIKREFREGNNLIKIIFINIGVFVAINIIQVISWLFTGSSDSIFSQIILANIQTYISIPTLLTKPWTIITYMFTHVDFFHLLFNMLWLYWMGKIFIDMLNGKRFIAIYLLGGIAGAVFTYILYNVIPVLHTSMSGPMPMIGASAAVMAIIVATATYFPDYKVFLLFFGQVKLKYIALIMVLLDVLFMSDSNSGGHIAHLGGALFGYMWASQLKRGTDISKWFLNILDFILDLYKPRKKVRVSYKNTQEKSYVQYEDSKKSNVSQQEIDAILDKIAKNGYDSLSAKEKEILFTMSKKN